MKNLLKFFALLLSISLFIVACEVDDLKNPEDDVELTEDNAFATMALKDVFGFVNDGTTTGKSFSACTSVVYTVGTKTLTIDFGSEGCLGTDGVTRKGVITTVFSGEARGWEAQETATITFTDYYSNGTKLEGTITITCNSVDAPDFTTVASNMVLTFSDSRTIKWSSTENVKRQGTDGWILNGETTGTCTARNGDVFSRASKDLISSAACKWFIGGSLTLTVGDNVTVVTFLDVCGKIKIKRNDLPEFEITL